MDPSRLDKISSSWHNEPFLASDDRVSLMEEDDGINEENEYPASIFNNKNPTNKFTKNKDIRIQIDNTNGYLGHKPLKAQFPHTFMAELPHKNMSEPANSHIAEVNNKMAYSNMAEPAFTRTGNIFVLAEPPHRNMAEPAYGHMANDSYMAEPAYIQGCKSHMGSPREVKAWIYDDLYFIILKFVNWNVSCSYVQWRCFHQ